jgi:DDE superfamily endonuclease
MGVPAEPLADEAQPGNAGMGTFRRPKKSASLYEAFPPAEAKRLVERFEWHYSPKHGSWLNMAESELAVLSNQCLDRRIPDQETLIKEIAAWEKDRNKHHTKAD